MPFNSGALSRQKNPATSDPALSRELSSSHILQSSGSSRRPGVSSSRDPALTSNEPEASYGRTTDASPGTLRRVTSTGQRSSPVVSSDQKRSTNTKNFESTLKGIEGLHF
nr:casein kinase 1-like protein 2 [Tanacetum cinerariifolium]